jgi:hypothetical protein
VALKNPEIWIPGDLERFPSLRGSRTLAPEQPDYSVPAGVEENGELGVRYGSDVRLVALAEKLAATGFALAIFTIAPS